MNIAAYAAKGEIPEIPYALGEDIEHLKETFADTLESGSEIHDLTVDEGEKTVWLDGGSVMFCYEKAKKDSFSLMWFTGAVCLILTVILVAVSGVYPQFYDTTETVRRAGQLFIIITALFFPVQGFLNALYFTLRSGGKTVITFLFDSVYSWTVTIPTALLLCNFTSLSIFAVYAIVQSLDLIKIVVGFVLVRKGVWISNLAE